MKIKKNSSGSSELNKMRRGGKKPSANQSKKTLYIIIVVAITAALIAWVYSMGRKAEETVQVAMTKTSIHKNQMITESMLTPYDMLKGEFEKFTTVKDGVKQRRIVLWDEIDKVVGSYAAYPLQANTYCEYRNFIKSRLSNEDSILYSFPGKDVVPLTIATENLDAFKTFLQPGDRVNITAIYKEAEEVEGEDEFGNPELKTVEVIKEEQLFTDIVLADLLNGSGNSVLDIYADFNNRTSYEQASLESSDAFKESVEPTHALLALTPEEKSRYLYYEAKSDAEFKMTLPQRVD